MTKPPRTMQPEGVDLTKAGRAAGKAFQEDSFHNYMARKIDLQRKQCGLILPPPPSPPPPAAAAAAAAPAPAVAGAAPEEEKKEESFSSISGHHQREERVRFDEEVTVADDSQPNNLLVTKERLSTPSGPATGNGGKRKRRWQQRGGGGASSSASGPGVTGIMAVVRRLKRRHGRVRRLTMREGEDEEPDDPAAGKDDESVATGSSSLASSAAESTPNADGAHNTTETLVEVHHQSEEVPVPEQQVDGLALKRSRPDLFFYGVVVLVNGYTDPDTETLQRMLHRHGGDLEKYETSRVTHIIAENLSTAKANVYKNRRRNPLPVCKPAWIVESDQAQKLLPSANYLIDEVRGGGGVGGNNGGMQSVASFFQKAAAETTASASTNTATADNTKGDVVVVGSVVPAAVPATESAGTLGSNNETSKAGEKTTITDDPSARTTEQLAADSRGTSSESFRNEESDGDGDEVLPAESSGVAARADESSKDDDAHIECEEEGITTTTTAEDNHHCADQDAADDLAHPASDRTAVSPTRNRKSGVDVDSEAVDRRKPPPQEPSPTSRGTNDDRYINGRIRTVGTDPNFLETFFNASRLSFIGSYKQRARQSPVKRGAVTKKGRRLVFHVDMDCFFAQVVLRNFPEHRDKPVAISHNGEPASGNNNSASPSSAQAKAAKDSTSECATCNYEARRFGIKKGMYLGRAKQLCPELIVLQYDFEGYEEVSEQVADILFRVAGEHDGTVEQVSCDEAYMELHIADDDNHSAERFAADLASTIRQEIFDRTQCTASIGIASNKLVAKLATDRVKPNGCLFVRDYRDILRPLQLRELHGIGYRFERKLADAGLTSVLDVWDLGESAETELVRVLGPGTGKKICSYCHGKDDRAVSPVERKTIGAECSYGVRFNGPYGVDHMIAGLAKEVEKRMSLAGVKGSKVTLKLKQRVEGAPPAGKYLGHGRCHNLSKSSDVGQVTRDWKVISKLCNAIFAELNVRTDDVRGMGVSLSKLSSDDGQSSPRAESKQSLRNWFQDSAAVSEVGTIRPAAKRARETDDQARSPERGSRKLSISATGGSNSEDDYEFDIALPSLSQIRMSQVEALPSPLRKQALSKIETKRKRSVPHSEIDLTSDKPARYRQTDMKRMLQLLNVKSGLETIPETTGVAVSLTQFEKLPLETQLQVANNDTKGIGALTLQKGRSKSRKRSRMQDRAAKRGDRANPLLVEPLGGGSRAGTEPTVPKSTVDASYYSSPAPEFFRENVYPLGVFLDENPGAGREEMEQVGDFLLLCVEENRLPDVVILLRSVKNRGDRWSADPFDWLLDQVNESIGRKQGMKLDVF